jgi:hypothetical protein
MFDALLDLFDRNRSRDRKRPRGGFLKRLFEGDDNSHHHDSRDRSSRGNDWDDDWDEIDDRRSRRRSQRRDRDSDFFDD